MSIPPDPITNRPPDDFGRSPRDEYTDRLTRRPQEIDEDEDYSPDHYAGRFTRSARLAGRWTRLGAAMLDGIIALVCAVPGLAVVAYSQSVAVTLDDTLLWIGIAVAAAGFLALNIYQWVLLSRQGQTLGKRAVGIRVVNYDGGGNPGFGMAVGLRLWVPGLISNAPYVGGCFSLIDVLFIFGEERRCLHDLIAKTKVVQVESGDSREEDRFS